jgi:hypothetical protein
MELFDDIILMIRVGDTKTAIESLVDIGMTPEVAHEQVDAVAKLYNQIQYLAPNKVKYHEQ